jgi:hypothetical protein
LIVHEQRIKGQQESTDEQALKVSNNGGRGSNRGRGQNSSSRGPGRRRQSKEFVKCFKCHKLGHFQNDFPDWESNVNYAEFNDDEEMLLMAQSDQESSGKNYIWFLDSGCSNHMIGQKEWFFDFDSSYRDAV